MSIATLARPQRLDRSAPMVMLVSDRRGLSHASLPALARAAARAGADLVQVREKDLEGRALRDLVAEVVEALAGTAARVLVNGRPDVAVAAAAQGVQLPEDGLPVAAVKRGFPGLLVSVSCHSVAGVLAAEAAGADLALLGPVFATPGKELRALGTGPLREACARASIPILAIGGIDAATASLALAAGAAGVAAIRPFLDRPEAAVRAFKAAAA